MNMSERPTTHSIAICALIALCSDPSSPLHDIEFTPQGNDSLSKFLEECVFRPVTNADLVCWIQHVRQCVGDDVTKLLVETMSMASDSVDSLIDLMESLRVAISEGLVDAASAQGVFLRQTCLGFEGLSFESVTHLWQDLKRSFMKLEQGLRTSEEAASNWPLSTTQLERILRDQCISQSQSHFGVDQSFEAIEIQVRSMMERDPELSEAYFLRFLNCLNNGERVGAIAALHQYFDHYHSIVKSTAPKEVLQFSAILLAIAYNSFGDEGLSLMATEEAVRVAQQSKDVACVAFALGWLFENACQGTTERRELLKRCTTRAAQGQLRSLVAGSRLALAKNYLEENRTDAASAWKSLMEVTSEQVTDNLPSLDRPTLMTQCPSEAITHLSRQRLVAAGIWEAFGMPALSGLSSIVPLRYEQDLSAADKITAIQNISRLALYGTPSGLVSPSSSRQAFSTSDNPYDESLSVVISSLLELHRVHGFEGSILDGSSLNSAFLVLLEAYANTGDGESAQVLEIVLDSCMRPGLVNKDNFILDVGFQKMVLLCRRHDWEKARVLSGRLLKMCTEKGLKNHRARILIQVVIMELESNPRQFVSALPPLLHSLSLCAQCDMHGLHAVALSVLAKIFLRLRSPKRSLAMLRAALPTLLQRENVWFQGDAYLTHAKCHLQLANGSTGPITLKLYRTALQLLKKSEYLFRKGNDLLRLQEIYYLQATVFSQLGCLDEREEASQKFVDLCLHLRSRTYSGALGLCSSSTKLRRRRR